MDRRERRRKRYQRILARNRRGSANPAKAKAKVARQLAKVCDARSDFLHKTSTDLVRRCDGTAVEDLAVMNMVKNRHLSKSISRTRWGQFRALLTYKAQR
jgi:putative transposase